jgi:hypothetical protein
MKKKKTIAIIDITSLAIILTPTTFYFSFHHVLKITSCFATVSWILKNLFNQYPGIVTLFFFSKKKFNSES